MTNKTKIKLMDATDGMRVQFVNHHHTIIRTDLNCTHMIGTVERHDSNMVVDGQSHFSIYVKLEDRKHAHHLEDWDNTLVFNYPDDEYYENVMVYVLEKPKQDVITEYFESCIEDIETIPNEFDCLFYVNDVFPCFGYKDFQIHIGHKDPKKNEEGFQDYSKIKRFRVYVDKDGELYDGTSFDTWEEVLEHVGYEESTLLEDLQDLTDQFAREKISEQDAINTLKSIAKYYSKD